MLAEVVIQWYCHLQYAEDSKVAGVYLCLQLLLAFFKDILLYHMVTILSFSPSSPSILWASTATEAEPSLLAFHTAKLQLCSMTPLCLQNQYHLCDSYTLLSLATCERYTVGPFGSIFFALTLSKHFLEDCTLMILFSIMILQPRLPV